MRFSFSKEEFDSPRDYHLNLPSAQPSATCAIGDKVTEGFTKKPAQGGHSGARPISFKLTIKN